MIPGARALAAALAAGTAVIAAAPPLEPPRLRGSEGLARAYDAILDARFDRSDAELARACGPAPPEACAVLRATGLWWRIQLDPDSLSLDAPFREAVDRAVESTEAWTERSPDIAESWFYLGGAYAARVQWRVLREERLAAARDGKRIKDALERAVTLDPELDDAYFGIGLYKYYADVAPLSAKFLRWLMLLPGGDRDKGLESMLRAQHRGELLQGEADYQLHVIYLWYEQKPDRALVLLEGLRDRYPWNPLFSLQIAELHDVYLHDATASLTAYRDLLSAARDDRVAVPRLAETRARLGIAKQLDAVAETDRALEPLHDIVNARPDAPFGALASAQLALGEAYDRLGLRVQAVAAYDAAIKAAPVGDPLEIRDRASLGIRRRPDTRVADAYRFSLEGWRQFERGDAATASVLLERALRLAPGDFGARSRYGRVLSARQQDAYALAELERAFASQAGAPPTLVAAAFLEAGALHERGGRRSQAAAMYRSAARVFGSGAELHATAMRALDRVAAQDE